MCNAMHGTSGMETISLRFFNVYGERQPLRGKYATVIGLFLRQAKGNLPLTIVGDGNQTRSFTHVSDVVDACYRAGLSVPWEGAFGDTYNVGHETSYSINAVARMMSNDTVSIPERLGEAKHTLSDSSKFKDVFGWKPLVSLEDWVAKNV